MGRERREERREGRERYGREGKDISTLFASKSKENEGRLTFSSKAIDPESSTKIHMSKRESLARS